MNRKDTSRELTYGTAAVHIYESVQAMGEAAAAAAARLIVSAIEGHGRARIIVATGNSQIAFINALTHRAEIDWKNVEVFHLDEYVNLPATHPASFRLWIQTRLVDKVHPGRVEFIQGDAPDLSRELERYAAILTEAPNDIAFVGFGENGHIAFNDPPVADFSDPLVIKRVMLDQACRRQQAGEGHFKDLDSVPKEAITVTCSTLLRVRAWVSVVPEQRKAQAVRNALEGPISTACPASVVRRHANANVYLDQDSASLLSPA